MRVERRLPRSQLAQSGENFTGSLRGPVERDNPNLLMSNTSRPQTTAPSSSDAEPDAPSVEALASETAQANHEDPEPGFPPEPEYHSEPERLEYHSPKCNVKHDTTPIGIDTITLMPKDWTVSETAHLRVSELTDFSTGEVDHVPLLVLEDGRIVKAGKATHNSEKFQVTIKGIQELYLQANLPKMFGPDNLRPVDTAIKFYRAIERLESKLSEIGINADLMSSKICRIDICRNIVTESPLIDYREVFQELTFPRMKPFRQEGKNPGWKNGTRQLLVYDKGAESNLPTDRLQRFEYRLMKARGVRAHLGRKTPTELAKHFGAVSETFQAAVKKLIPNQPPKSSETARLTQGGIEAALEALSDSGRQISDTLYAIALQYLRCRGDVGSFDEAIREQKGRQAARRYRKKFDKLSPVADLLSENERTATEMKRELRTKLLA